MHTAVDDCVVYIARSAMNRWITSHRLDYYQPAADYKVAQCYIVLLEMIA